MNIKSKKIMSYNLKHYLKVYDNFLDKTTCDNIVQKLKSLQWREHTYMFAESKPNSNIEDELTVCDHIFEKDIAGTIDIQSKIWYALQKYVLEDHKHMTQWCSGWNGYSHVRYNRYNENMQFKLHCDQIHTLFDGNIKGIPVLSIIGALNNDFEGGELVFWEEEVVNLKAGQILIFPSNFLYPHRVKKVTKGTRYSYVSWAY